VVETIVPEGGLGKTLDAMHDFHKRHGIEAHTGKRRRDFFTAARNWRERNEWYQTARYSSSLYCQD
jgi:hypothetical protein